MINYSNLQIEKLVIHRVGNKHRGEKNFISKSLFHPNAEMEDTLLHYFLKPIEKTRDIFRFQNLMGDNYNKIFGYASIIFGDKERFQDQAVNILYHLYNQSDHPNIKSGEVYITYFSDLLIDDEVVDAVGIFKSEVKSTFLQVSDTGENLLIDKLEGIHIEKLDKGCLIVNSEQADGFRVLSVDNNRYDALYWTHHFLNVDLVEDENFHTKLYLDMCKEFSTEVIAPQTDKREQVQFLANSVDYFAKHEVFDFEDFANQVVPNGDFSKEFRQYQEDFGLENVNGFEISQTALKTAKRKIKNSIRLDTNMQIKLDFNKLEDGYHFIERGYDEKRQMYFYKLYFNEELS